LTFVGSPPTTHSRLACCLSSASVADAIADGLWRLAQLICVSRFAWVSGCRICPG
jgi:hypothetical protein